MVVANDYHSNFIDSWGVVSTLVLFRISNNMNGKITKALLSENVVHIKKYTRERVAVTERLLNGVKYFSVKVRILPFPMVESIVSVVKIELRIQWLLAFSWNESSCRVVNLVASFPHPWTMAIDVDIVLVGVKRGESKGAVVLADVLAKVSCFRSLICKKRTNGWGGGGKGARMTLP